MRSNKANKQSKFIFQIIFAPIKILSKARDFYMKSMQDCAGKIGYGAVTFGGPAVSESVYLPKSFSVSYTQSGSCNNEELRQLLRRRRSVIQSSNMHIAQREVRVTTMVSCDEGRSYSVGLGRIGRIDEDRPCSFKEGDDKDADLYLRSRSHALRRNIVYQ
ncbi:uncharacterized protein LOC125370455 [Ricinus communis]|uniref:uncharacterized protein LOC125370455 n=1 Tax=Ricinus communis TaxID=3988 RepID=UPI00201A7DFE|nr:uncharacterized protein LOC125370455 [Ricinus communis]